MSHKLDPILQQVEDLEVACLESGQVLGTPRGIQVARLNAREFGQIIHHLQ